MKSQLEDLSYPKEIQFNYIYLRTSSYIWKSKYLEKLRLIMTKEGFKI